MASTPLAGRTVVVTGAGSGIGRALAQRLAGDGCPLALCDWNEDDLAETVASITGPVFSQKLDVRDRQGQLAFAAAAREWAPAPFGALVNNAGVTVSQLQADAAPEDDEWVIDVNYWGVVHGVRAWLPVFLEQGSGTIANVSSIFGFVGWPSQAAYCASKAAVRGYTEALRHELRDSGVSVACVHPGGIATGIVKHSRFRADDKGRTDRAAIERDFELVAKTSPRAAAKVIQRGIEKGSARILIGPDAYGLSGLSRALPVRYFDVIQRLEPIVRRK